MVSVTVKDIWMQFGKVVALRGVSLNVEKGEFLTLLGPSGCGKTTMLRIIAGLYMPTRGRVLFDSEDVTDKPPWERNVGLVFQDYALWPHMRVYDNIAYGLRIRRLPASEVRRRVNEVAELLGIQGLLDRYPHQLSGGQQQRVALARALVIEPRVLLLDEPLSNLDAKVRINVRGELKKLQKRFGITTIYVTHDQEEALVISDRIAVMNMGAIEQIGTPVELYMRPRTVFVADFIGQINLFRGKVAEIDPASGVMRIDLGFGLIDGVLKEEFSPGNDVYVLFRPEHVSISTSPVKTTGNVLRGIVDSVHYLGNIARLYIRINDTTTIKAEVHRPTETKLPGVGDLIFMHIDPKYIMTLKG